MRASDYVEIGNLKVAKPLAALVEDEILPGLNFDPDQVWGAFEKILADLAPRNKDLLAKREKIQQQIDDYHRAHQGAPWDAKNYKKFLKMIGYLVAEGADFEIGTQNVDDEIAKVAGPQLVVPVMNARFALNAANARWGSLYDGLYGTDAISTEGELAPGKNYNEKRGAEVIARAAAFLDQAIPLAKGTHGAATSYQHKDEQFCAIIDGEEVALKNPDQFVGTRETRDGQGYLFVNNGLHVEVVINKDDPIGQQSGAGVKDVIVEAALTTIQDCEDSVAAVDAEDKTIVYRNWLGLMKGDLQSSFTKNGKEMVRSLNGDLTFTGTDGKDFSLPGRSLMLVRNVGHLMTNNAVLYANDEEVPEGMLDAMITVLCALHDLNKSDGPRNSRAGSIYIVKPKMHGPEEAALTDELFDRVEDAYNLPRHTIKVGVMDEERRTTVNLKECIRAVKDRVVFINTGFLDRTGDEIHTSMLAGPVLPKGDIKGAKWLTAYENWNVDTGLETGFSKKAQIGKGMWAMPDEMAKMLDTKTDHLKAGANCAWVPSPTAAVLHATHYHQIDVFDVQAQLKQREKAALDDILTPPLLEGRNLSEDEVQNELENNAQGILGYVVRWIDQGVGCSKVPDIHDVGLMEDRATLRISAQHIANWLLHGLVTEDQVREAMKKMAKKVDAQNADDPAYKPMADNFDRSVAFAAACELVFEGKNQPSGYTEPILHRRRLEAKAKA
ncbi:malate synthase G [Maritalea mediterranea]|uniref:Malate synthase G n=1 Tax=Maritalea mediterranea TaxID=2909667 RepID=A0ABS9E3X1_9HYPH|nr:malate synthase G [Maritalea mediterranea]MCF4097565.1 malate synthase G [Maritalea mediterranea]